MKFATTETPIAPGNVSYPYSKWLESLYVQSAFDETVWGGAAGQQLLVPPEDAYATPERDFRAVYHVACVGDFTPRNDEQHMLAGNQPSCCWRVSPS